MALAAVITPQNVLCLLPYTKREEYLPLPMSIFTFDVVSNAKGSCPDLADLHLPGETLVHYNFRDGSFSMFTAL